MLTRAQCGDGVRVRLPGCCYRGIVGDIYTTGYCAGNTVQCTWGCGNDSPRGKRWIELAAGQNYAPAMVQLGTMYLLGNSITDVNKNKAFRSYFAPAAYAGDQDAQYYLASAYRDGINGYAQNPEQAWFWYTIAKQKAALIGDAQTEADCATGLNILALRNTGGGGNDGGCDNSCQQDARSAAYQWVPTLDACNLNGAQATRESFCSGFGEPAPTVTNDPLSFYTSCQCKCDAGYFPDPGASSGCLDGRETTTTLGKTRPTTTTTTTTTGDRACRLQDKLFFGPWRGAVGAHEPYFELLTTLSRCARNCLQKDCEAIVFIDPDNGNTDPHGHCYLFDSIDRSKRIDDNEYMTIEVSTATSKVQDVQFYIRDPLVCAPSTSTTSSNTATTTTTTSYNTTTSTLPTVTVTVPPWLVAANAAADAKKKAIMFASIGAAAGLIIGSIVWIIVLTKSRSSGKTRRNLKMYVAALCLSIVFDGYIDARSI